MDDFPDHLQFTHLTSIESYYQRFKKDPESVAPSWRYFFEGIDVGASFLRSESKDPSLRIMQLVQAYRRSGYLSAQYNPLEERQASAVDLQKLGFSEEELDHLFPTLGFLSTPQACLREILHAVQAVYSGPVGFEYMDLGDFSLESWMQKQIEPQGLSWEALPSEERVLSRLMQAETFERFLHKRYPGQTRFSLEGAETLIPMLDALIEEMGREGEGLYIGMAHRGRLNVLAHILQKPLEVLLQEFEEDLVLSLPGQDDVRYHLGFQSEWTTAAGGTFELFLSANPSHLESVDPIVLGHVRCAQKERGKKVAALLIHGDASIAGQGVVYETLQLMRLAGYEVGGSLHIVLNNQIGYTTFPHEGRSMRHATDIAKAFGCPVFHVNAEDPKSCLFAVQLAEKVRREFHIDVFIDLLCYRLHGHNEGDEPSLTQPQMVQKIRSKESIAALYAKKMQTSRQAYEALQSSYREELEKALSPPSFKPREAFSQEEGGVSTQVSLSQIQQLQARFTSVPEGFHLHSKLQKWLEKRKAASQMDWAHAEFLAIATLLVEQVPIRFVGQDSQRGTFNQRHFTWTDAQTGSIYCPLLFLQEGQAGYEGVNSPLTEFAGLGFEYGYSLQTERTLVLWEAQYGDFINGAQIVIDQYVAGGEKKWQGLSSLTLLLPHGYEGAGPEHSSARLERFLQLAAEKNIQVTYPSTPAQYFHLLRRQALRRSKKPLILLTPKALLRDSRVLSPLSSCVEGGFTEVLDDETALSSSRRLLFCTGKIFFDLQEEREKFSRFDIALIRFEQLYPYPQELCRRVLQKYSQAEEFFWVQEEPQNMGAWSFVQPHLSALLPKGALLQYRGRAMSASVATGSKRRHQQEQKQIIRSVLE